LQRKIGHYEGDKHGDLIIALGAMHGNEPAGVHALQTLFDMLQKEPLRNAAFQFSGRLVGLVGNVQALERRQRFVKKDLNRQLTPENIDKERDNLLRHVFEETPLWIRSLREYTPVFEDLELIELIETIENEIVTYQPKRLIVLDLHTTSADGGIFSIVADNAESLALAETLHAPVVMGMIGAVGGSTLHYFTEKNMGIPTVAVAFESGQHDDLYSSRRAVAWLVHVLRSVGAISQYDVENRHEIILKNYSRNLPKTVQFLDSHPITAMDEFKMFGNFRNFQPVRKGEILAKDRHGFIVAPQDCRVLMPLYQTQGSEGFFLVI
jgi:succinylglutamate desuccinylase